MNSLTPKISLRASCGGFLYSAVSNITVWLVVLNPAHRSNSTIYPGILFTVTSSNNRQISYKTDKFYNYSNALYIIIYIANMHLQQHF